MPAEKRSLKVFLSYASQDKPVVRELSRRLADEGWIDPWVDEKKLLPGQDWRTKIEEAVETSDIVIICLSSNSVTKEGFVQKELRYAREIAFEKPDETIFLIPLRLDDCTVPRGLRFFQWGDYFGEQADETYNALLESLKLRYEQKLRLEEEERARHEKERQEREAREKIVREKTEQETAESIARERAEREAAEKAKWEKAERETAERTAREKAKREAAERIKREKAERQSAQRMAIKKLFSNAIPSLRVIGILGIVVVLFWTGSWAIPKIISLIPKPTPRTTDTTQTTSNSSYINSLITLAQDEGTLNVIALPHDWCNYGEIIETFKAKYGIEINELSPEAGTGDQLEAIRANKDNRGPQSPDVIDIGFAYASSAKNENLLMPYKLSVYDTIPSDLKDTNGYWYGGYFGVISFLVNTDVQPNVPKDWADLLKPQYYGQVALSGDPRTSNQAIQSVFAAALANGGSLDNAQPGLNFISTMNKNGNLIPFISNNGLVASGETPVRITWDYFAYTARDSFAGSPNTQIVIPLNGRLGGVYLQAISAYAPHPNAAKLWMEFLYSDEGQLLWMKGYCHPVREDDLRARGVVPTELSTKMLDTSGVVFPTAEQLIAAKEFISNNWDTVVGINIQSK